MKRDFWFALYVFCADYHGGQWSRGYRILSKLSSQYRMRVSDGLMVEMRESPDYADLVAKYGGKI